MEKKPSLSRPQRLLRSERWRPYIRFEKETGEWIAKAVKEEQSGEEEMEKTMDQMPSKIKIIMERNDLDVIARIVAYIYHDKKDNYSGIASDLRKEHIYKDLRSIDQWLNIQYQRMNIQDEKYKKINKLDKEITNEQSE